MSASSPKNKSTICVHSGNYIDPTIQASVTPIFPGTSHAYLDKGQQFYPRYFNIPNQQAVVKKVCALEYAEDGILFGSGMAAISTTLLSLLRPGDHIVFQEGLYGGTTQFARKELSKWGISYSFTNGNQLADFEQQIKEHTRMIFIETPSNPLLAVVDIALIAALAKSKDLISVIDNTFASPINQNPILLGIDVVLHSATKYLGGHSDICAGLLLTSNALTEQVRQSAKNLGGSMNAQTASLLERSIKTLHLRVERQNQNALALAEFLFEHPEVDQVNYPGLPSHPDHEVAAQQMRGFGGMLSFELADHLDPVVFQQELDLILPSMSLGSVESTICSPYLTSHAYFGKEIRLQQGISDNLLRLSVGVEDAEELTEDINAAIRKSERVPG
ncbi:MAG: aminotransferase class I/II-fold pyridoxal phosphate-dependent enzyme [Bacteroidota bacterium]